MKIIKKGAIILLATILVCPIPGSAQNQNVETDDLGNSVKELGNSVKEFIGLFKHKKNNAEKSNATDAALVSNSAGTMSDAGESSSVGDAFRIITNHPDFKIKVLRCEASGSTCVIDMIFENIGSQDVNITIYGGYWNNSTSVAYDDEANKYSDQNFLVAIANHGLTYYYQKIDLPADIPLKARVQIEGVKASARMFRRIDLNIRCDSWGIDGYKGKTVKFFNVPISREGDE